MTQHAPCPLHSIHLEQVGVRRGRHVVLDHISTTFHCGEMTALMGANGAGKTTLLRAILGEISYSGSIVFRNENGKTIKPAVLAIFRSIWILTGARPLPAVLLVL